MFFLVLVVVGLRAVGLGLDSGFDLYLGVVVVAGEDGASSGGDLYFLVFPCETDSAEVSSSITVLCCFSGCDVVAS